MRVIKKEDYEKLKEDFFNLKFDFNCESKPLTKIPSEKGNAIRIESVHASVPAERSVWIGWQIYNKLKDSEDNSLSKILKKVYEEIGKMFVIEELGDKPNFKEFLNYIVNNENYLSIVIILKFIIERLNLPLKGKSLEEYHKGIVNECKKMLAEKYI